jgi:hypothetical protein
VGFLCELAEDVGDKLRTRSKQGTSITRVAQGSQVKTSAWLREQGDWNGSVATSEGWVLLEGRACEIARARAQLDLQQAHKQGTVNDYLQSLRQRGHVELAHAGLTMLNVENTCILQGADAGQHWMAWLDWEVRFVRPSWEANVTTWNLGPLGYEYSRSQLQQLLTKGQAVVMVQEVRFPLEARQRVKNELKHLHPEYYCFLEAGKDPLSSDGDGMDIERPKSPSGPDCRCHPAPG